MKPWFVQWNWQSRRSSQPDCSNASRSGSSKNSACAEESWLAIALVWVNWNADDADQVYANNKVAAHSAAQRALTAGWPSRADLTAGLTSLGNPFYAPKSP